MLISLYVALIHPVGYVRYQRTFYYYYYKWSQIVSIGRTLSQMVINGRKWSQTVANGRK